MDICRRMSINLSRIKIKQQYFITHSQIVELMEVTQVKIKRLFWSSNSEFFFYGTCIYLPTSIIDDLEFVISLFRSLVDQYGRGRYLKLQSALFRFLSFSDCFAVVGNRLPTNNMIQIVFFSHTQNLKLILPLCWPTLYCKTIIYSFKDEMQPKRVQDASSHSMDYQLPQTII